MGESQGEDIARTLESVAYHLIKTEAPLSWSQTIERGAIEIDRLNHNLTNERTAHSITTHDLLGAREEILGLRAALRALLAESGQAAKDFRKTVEFIKANRPELRGTWESALHDVEKFEAALEWVEKYIKEARDAQRGEGDE